MRWIYHAAPATDWDTTAASYAPATLAREGFIHGSFRDRVVESARLYMPKGAPVVVLQIDPRRLGGARVVVAETPRGAMPHVHGEVPRDAVVRTWSVEDFDAAGEAAPDAVRGTRFAFVAFEGMTLLDLVGALDPVSRIASMGFDPTATCTLVGTHDTMVWRGAGARLTVDEVGGPLDRFDVLVVPGGHGTRALAEDPEVVAWLARFPANRLHASVCTGALLLGAAGRLRGLRATTHASALDRLSAYGAIPTRQRVVDEGHVITAGGVSSALDLGMQLVRRIAGEEVARAIAAQMELPPGYFV